MNARKLCLVASVSLACFAAVPARAVIPVEDPGAIAQLVTEAKQGYAALTEAYAQGKTLISSFEQMKSIYESFSHLTNASEIIPLLTNTLSSNPLPSSMAGLQSMFDGAGLSSTYQSAVQEVMGRDPGYSPNGTDYNSQRINRDAVAAAGQAVVGQSLYQSSTQRLTGLNDLNAVGANAKDPKDTADLTFRGVIETAKSVVQGNIGVSSLVQQQAERARQDASRQQAAKYAADSLEIQARASATSAADGNVELITGGQ